jgi:hypothetical protein
MSQYQAPLRDIAFVQQELLGMEQYFQTTDTWQGINAELVDAVLNESAKFCQEVLAPLNQIGDIEGCQLLDGVVKTPTGFKEAYQQFVEGGWPSLEGEEAYGGQAFPKTVAIACSEMSGTANWAWGMYPGLSHGACHTVAEHGTDEQKSCFLPNLISGKWTGTMCLTEPHCGTDLGMLRTKAEPNNDGGYMISGTKIFISSGEHDLAENIVHIVLARLPDAPKGTKGISLFIVPKFNADGEGNLTSRNAVACGSLEHKMGIHGNATCVMNFDGATGYLLGEANRGLNAMFTFMNTARIGTAMQGLAHAEWAYQNSLVYAKDRLQMRSLSGPKTPTKEADPIIVHADVRRMLLTQKVFAEGARMLVYWMANISDKTQHPGEEDAAEAEELLSLLTPIAKAFATETGFEAANLGIQVYGGHGYIAEWGMEQKVRDSRISMLYEGTTGIQALDLLARKILLKGGEPLTALIAKMSEFCKQQQGIENMEQFIKPLSVLLKSWGDNTMKIGLSAMENPDEVGAASVDYLMYSGYITYAYLWAKAAAIAQQKLAENDDEFYRNKLYSAQFYYQRILPRTAGLEQTMLSGAGNLIAAGIDPFSL